MATDIEYIVDDERLQEILTLKKEGWENAPVQAKSKTYRVDDIGDFKLHEYVYINPPHSTKEFDDLLESLSTNGQIEPIKVWEKNGSKFIIDGRNRLYALKKLGAKYIKYTVIPSNTTKEEIKTIIIESENKRQMTPAQNAIRAWYDYTENHKVTGESMRAYASKYHTGHAMLSRCNTIADAKGYGKGVIDALFNYKQVELGGSYYKSLNQVITHIENNKPKKSVNIGVPESVVGIMPMITSLYDNCDDVGLAYMKKKISKMIVELNKEQ